jgi:alpha 1,2-mannosyltransferase
MSDAYISQMASIPVAVNPSYMMYDGKAVRRYKKQIGTANATFIILARNSEQGGLVQSITQLEKVFNSKYHYPYVILNDDHFTEEFMSAINNITESEVKYGFVDKDMWGYPDWVDQKKAADGRAKAVKDNVPYADSESYRHMCRY